MYEGVENESGVLTKSNVDEKWDELSLKYVFSVEK